MASDVGGWKLESHIKLLYCLHFLTLLVLALGFLYVYLVSNKIYPNSQLYVGSKSVGSPAIPGVDSESRKEDFDKDGAFKMVDDEDEEDFNWKVLSSSSSSSSSAFTSKERTKRNPVLSNDKTLKSETNFYRSALEEQLALAKKEPYDKPKGKRLKVRIMFNDNDTVKQQQKYEGTFTSVINDPTIVSLPLESSSSNDPSVVVPIYSKLQLNDLKDFCFSITDFCADQRALHSGFSAPTEESKKNLQQSSQEMKIFNDQNGSQEHVVTTLRQDEFNLIPPAVYENFSNEGMITNTTQSVVHQNSPGDNASATVPTTKIAKLVPLCGLMKTKPCDSISDNKRTDKAEIPDFDEDIEDSNAADGKPRISSTARKRKRCFVHAVGKPIEVGYRKVFFGAWMRDIDTRNDFESDKRYVTEHFTGISLLEYSNEGDLYKPELNPVKTHILPHMYEGMGHVIYRGALYYHRASSPNIVRHDIYHNYTRETTLRGAAYSDSNYLYADSSLTYFDFAIDENGLWVMYRFEGETFLTVSRLHPKTLRLLRTWNLTEIDPSSVGNAWITCGVVYMIKNAKIQNTTLYFAYDLYARKYAKTEHLDWYNHYGNANMIAYNPKDRRVYVYDNGHLILVPLALHFVID